MRYFVFFFICFLAACSKGGGSWQAYRISAFAEASQRDLGIFLHITDESCAKQTEALNALIKDPDFKAVAAFRTEIGRDKAVERQFHVTGPCSLIVFKGDKERGRTSSSANYDYLDALMRRALY